MVTIRGYHGTSVATVGAISAGGLLASDNHDDWLGGGIYFFIDGLAEPQASALEWARCKAWDKTNRQFRDTTYAVVSADIVVPDDALFDLREAANAREFHRERHQWIKTALPVDEAYPPRPLEKTYDKQFADHFKAANRISALIADFHIQLSVRERYFRFDSRIPNVSVLCVSVPHRASIKVEIANIDVRSDGAHLDLQERK